MSTSIFTPDTLEQALSQIENIWEKDSSASPYIILIDGRAGSGKTTLGTALADLIPDSLLVHLDDYFLRPEQRTKERLAIPGGNVDAERLIDQLVDPLIHGLPGFYEPWSCKDQCFKNKRTVSVPKVLILEGSYAMNDWLNPYGQLRIFTTCSPAIQQAAILERSTPEKLEQFIQKWIPLEENYFEQLQGADRADLVLNMDRLHPNHESN